VTTKAEPNEYHGHLELDAAPKNCAAFREPPPFESKIVSVRWTGWRVWIPLGEPRVRRRVQE
jgi:hypothetical protein